jgi:hypothetical protein
MNGSVPFIPMQLKFGLEYFILVFIYETYFIAINMLVTWSLDNMRGHTLYIYIYMLWLYSPLLGLGRFFSFLILYTVGRTPWTEDQPIARPLPTHRTTQTQNKHRQTSMPEVGFEPTIGVFERANTVHALDRGATVIGHYILVYIGL